MEDLSKKILNKIDLKNFKLSDSYFYNSLPLCAIDSIFSIGVKYESVKNVVDNFCKYKGLKKYRDDYKFIPKIQNQYLVSDFLNDFKDVSNEELAKNIFKNSQRTSSKSGILKSQAVVELIEILNKYNINCFQDLATNNNDFDNDFINIRGQKSGISLKYFYMLAGSNDLIKPDRMIIRFLENNLNRAVPIEESLAIIKNTCLDLKNSHSIIITPRELDNAIWSYQRKQ